MGTRNFDRALKVNVGIEKLLCAELIRIRHKQYRVLRQIKHAQRELKSEISTRKNEKFQVKNEEKELHENMDAVLKSFEKTADDGTNKVKPEKSETTRRKSIHKHRSYDANESYLFDQESTNSLSSASSGENVDDNPSVQQWTNGNGCYSASRRIKSELSSSIDSWAKQMASRTDKEVSTNMALRTIAPQAPFVKVNPAIKVDIAGQYGIRNFSSKPHHRRSNCKNFSLDTTAIRLGKYPNLAATNKQTVCSAVNSSLMLTGYRASISPEEQVNMKKRVQNNQQSLYGQWDSVSVNRPLLPFARASIHVEEVSHSGTPFSNVNFVPQSKKFLTKTSLGVRPITASPKSATAHRRKNMHHRPITAVGFSANHEGYQKYRQTADQNAPTTHNFRLAAETHQSNAAPIPRKALSSYGRHKPDNRSATVNHSNNLQEDDFRMQLRLQRQQTENEAIARRVWQFIGKRPLGLTVD